MAAGSPRRAVARRGRSRGAGVCLLFLWLAAAAAIHWLGGTLQQVGRQGSRLERSGAADGRSGGYSGATNARGSTSSKPPMAVAATKALSAATQQPQHKFLMFFSGHQGSSALADMLAQDPSVFVPGFEPLDVAGLTPEQKVEFLSATFSFPRTAAAWPAWRAALAPSVPGLRVDHKALRSYDQLEGKSVAGFKLRPYMLGESAQGSGGGVESGSASSRDSNSSTEAAAAAAGSSRGHTAMTGLSPIVVRELLHRHNVSVVLTVRHNLVKEALSWHKARDLGISQFQAIKAGGKATSGSRSSEGTAHVGGSSGDARQPQQAQQVHRAAGSASTSMVTVDIPRVLHWLNYTVRVNEELRRAVAYYNRPNLTVWYEDFLADPLGEARRVAAFIGVSPADVAALQLSSKFKKAGPDAIQGWMANYRDLCRALEGSPHCQHLDAVACASQLRGAAGSGSSNGADSNSSLSRAGSSSASAGGSADAPTPQPEQLLDSWCLQQDKEASGWGALSGAECMRQFRALRSEAVAAVRNGTGTLLFKHVHKAGGTTLCRLARVNMIAESASLPLRQDWDTNCVPYESFLGPHPAVSGTAELFMPQHSAEVPTALPTDGDATPAAQQHRRRLQSNWLGGACWLGFLAPPQLRALPDHYRPLTFVASEGPLPDALPLDSSRMAMMTMLRQPLDRVLSSYRWWKVMLERMPLSPAECHAYSAPPNASFEQWLQLTPDNWMTRELVGRSALYDWRRRPLTGADLAIAQRRLHLFAAVLLLEEPRSSMAAMHLFGWKDVGWDEHRAGSRADSYATAQLEAAVLERLRQRNQWDLKLYAYAQLLHAEQASAGWTAS